jgi:hypothetical protein
VANQIWAYQVNSSLPCFLVCTTDKLFALAGYWKLVYNPEKKRKLNTNLPKARKILERCEDKQNKIIDALVQEEFRFRSRVYKELTELMKVFSDRN